MANKIKILILGATGMLGHTLALHLSSRNDFDVHATVRSLEGVSRHFPEPLLKRLRTGVDAEIFDSVLRTFAEVKPDLVINCIGVIKQVAAARDPLVAIPLNSLFPHRLAIACAAVDARLIHVSTDCIFAGDKGNYSEIDHPDPADLYGRSKLLGEVDYPHCVTLRTSIIGHELKGHFGLVDWFLSREGTVRGYARAIYTGFPTVEMARIIADFVIPNVALSGIYHVSSDPISKFELLLLIARLYGKKCFIERDEEFFCDRSLDSRRFREETGYTPPPWPMLIEHMYEDALGRSGHAA